MLYEIEIINKKNKEVTFVEVEDFKIEYSVGRLGHHKPKEPLQIGIPNGKRFKWFDKYHYSIVVRELYTGRRITTLE